MSDWLAKFKEEAKSGYSFIPGWLLFDKRVSDEAKITFTVIYKMPGKKKSEYIKRNYPLEFYAALRGLSTRTIQRHLRELKKTDRFWVRQHKYNKPCTITIYMGKDE